MIHRLPVKISILLICYLATFVVQAGPIVGRSPNVLLIAIDDLNDWVGYLGGHPLVKTPNMDRLAKMGVAFTNAHTQAPVCNPSRSSFITGLRPTTTGIYALNGWFRDIEKYKDHQTFFQYFEKHGYFTMTTGKVFHDAYPPADRRKDGPEVTKWGFKGAFLPRPDEPIVKNTGHPLIDWGVYPEEDSQQDDWKVADWAIEQLKNPPKKQPFFLSVGFRHPHVPLYATQKWFDLYPEDDYLLPVVRADDREDIPFFSWYLHWYLPEPRLAWLMMNHQWKAKVRGYLASVSFADMLVGRLLDTLEEEELLENTIIVLLSDHGYHLGSKAISGKNTLWHESTRVPLIFAGPGVKEIGKTSSEPAELLDVFPTLVDLAGLPKNEAIDGHSLKPILDNVTYEREWPAITSHGPGNHSVVTRQWRYIQYADGSEELYNIIEDPYEWKNLVRVGGYEAILEKMRGYIPNNITRPLEGNVVRLQEMRNGVPYWEGEPIKGPVPMSFK
ncbi:MAG: sulfatase [Bacteroidota bacterium]